MRKKTGLMKQSKGWHASAICFESSSRGAIEEEANSAARTPRPRAGLHTTLGTRPYDGNHDQPVGSLKTVEDVRILDFSVRVAPLINTLLQRGVWRLVKDGQPF
jgi:hypothetical protein